jgi:uncharacterized protein
MTDHCALPELDSSDRDHLLTIARRSLAEMVQGRDFVPPRPSVGSALERRDGVFVTLKRRQRLRGCIGHLVGSQPLPGSVATLARSAAREDPRFPPLRPEELDGLRIEVTVMSPLEPIDGVDQVEVGRHGLVVEQGFQRGLLLPQVATEQGWDAMTFLEHTCHKAGLPPDAWSHGAKVFRFEAVFFGEAD